MIDDQLVLKIERLRDEIDSLNALIRHTYSTENSQVVSSTIRKQATDIAERWLVEVAGSQAAIAAIGEEAVAERTIQFQRLLICAERATIRRKYDQSLKAILAGFRSDVIVPLKASRANDGLPLPSILARPRTKRAFRDASVAFVGQSFALADKPVNEVVHRVLTALGLEVITGEKPRSDYVSKKVMARIDKADVFVGIFTRREKLEGKAEWSTSAWIIEEKSYAIAKGKKLILLREEGVASIGGMQGDYEYLPFDRSNLADVIIRIVDTYMAVD